MTLDTPIAPAGGTVIDLLSLNEAMDSLSALDARRARIVELRIFGGMTGDDDITVLNSMGHLAGLLQYKGDRAKADALLRTVMEGTERIKGPEDTVTLRRRNTYCAVLLKQQKIDEALACFKELYETRKRSSNSGTHNIGREKTRRPVMRGRSASTCGRESHQNTG